MQNNNGCVLFIGPRTFGYETEIQNELERAGYAVDWYDERPSSGPLIKALLRVWPALISIKSDRYYDKIIKHAATKQYDIVFIIKGEALSLNRLIKLRAVLPDSRFIYYTWDSLSNFKNGLEKIPYFDKAYSFDLHDAKNNINIVHLPLFYTCSYEWLAQLNADKDIIPDIGLLFLGSIHTDRYSVMKKIYLESKKSISDLVLYSHLYFQSKWVFAIRKLINKDFRSVPWAMVKWHALEKSEVFSLITRCEVLIDIQHVNQTGLTMRTIECIGANKKLITTNDEVRNYDFYNPNNILVVDRKNPKIPSSFLMTPYQIPKEDIYKKYSISEWLKAILA